MDLRQEVVLPAGMVTRVDMDDRSVHVELTKGEMKSSPEFDPERYRTPEYPDQLAACYTRFRRTA